MDGVPGVEIRPWEARDRSAVQALLKLLSEDAEVRAADAPTYVAEKEGQVVGMVTPCVFTTPPPEGFVSPMTWGVEDDVTERFAAAGVPEENISFERDTYTFNSPARRRRFSVSSGTTTARR